MSREDSQEEVGAARPVQSQLVPEVPPLSLEACDVASVLASQLVPCDWLLVVPPMTSDAMTATAPNPAKI